MVLKPLRSLAAKRTGFENDVEMYGAQTYDEEQAAIDRFENDVEMYGAQTTSYFVAMQSLFENDVEMYGAQTVVFTLRKCRSLRMM